MMGRREGAVLISLERGGSSGSAWEHTMYQLGLVWEVKPSLPFQSVLGLEDSTAASSFIFLKHNTKNHYFISSMPREIQQCYEEQVLHLCGISTIVCSNHLLKGHLQKKLHGVCGQGPNCPTWEGTCRLEQARIPNTACSQQALILISCTKGITQ